MKRLIILRWWLVALLCLFTVELQGFESPDNQEISALCGGKGYGEGGLCIQDPGAEAGAYVYAGTALPYEAPYNNVSVPDSLDVLFINHIGRHGARYLSSDKFTKQIFKRLGVNAEPTVVGQRVQALCQAVDSMSSGNWGALDALGKKEQKGIGERFASRYGKLLQRNDSITGISSYIPRCVMSMDEMTYGVVWQNRNVEMTLGSGRRYNPLVRPFDCDSAYKQFRKGGAWSEAYSLYMDSICPAAVALRLDSRGSRLLQRLSKELLANGVQCAGGPLEMALSDTLAGEWPAEWEREAGMSKREAQDLALALYSVVSGMQSVFYTEQAPEGVYYDWRNYFTEREYSLLWECSNLKHYLEYSSSCFSDVPARMAAPLLSEMLTAMNEASQSEYRGPAAKVRFGHAETLMPLFALMRLPGCYYISEDLGSVSDHWQDFNVVPMASNLQMVLCKSKTSGQQYLLMYLNERMIAAPEMWSDAFRRLQGLLDGE